MFSCCFFNPTSSSKGTQDEADSDTCTVSAKYIEVLRPTNLSTNNNGQPSLAADGQHRRVPDSGNSASRQHVPRSKDNNDTSALGFQQQQQKLQGRGEGGDQPWSEPMHTGTWKVDQSIPPCGEPPPTWKLFFSISVSQEIIVLRLHFPHAQVGNLGLMNPPSRIPATTHPGQHPSSHTAAAIADMHSNMCW